jgi:hypothetical protein
MALHFLDHHHSPDAQTQEEQPQKKRSKPNQRERRVAAQKEWRKKREKEVRLENQLWIANQLEEQRQASMQGEATVLMHGVPCGYPWYPQQQHYVHQGNLSCPHPLNTKAFVPHFNCDATPDEIRARRMLRPKRLNPL